MPHGSHPERANERGAALLEFVIAIALLFALISLVFDAGLGYTTSRDSSAVTRSAARVGALAGEQPLADFRILDSVKAEYGDGNGANGKPVVVRVTVYRTTSGGNGEVPAGCDALGGSVVGLCNVYPGTILGSFTEADFATQTDPFTGDESCVDGSLHAAWCPVDRRANEGDYLGVAVWTEHEPTVGLLSGGYELEDHSVFALYFTPLPISGTPVAGGRPGDLGGGQGS